ncbi:MAG: hypothetical protein Q4B45_10425 [Coriobacteriia bacterium]|nr:hypothetical protein [Coriobacteriia bacterium]
MEDGTGVLWPRSVPRGSDDCAMDPVAARELRDALGRDEVGSPWAPVLCGMFEATVSEDLAVPVPEELLKGATRLYVTESETGPGFLFCQAAPRRMGEVARLIKAEQALEGYPWDYADDFEQEFRLYALGNEVEVVDGVLSLRETSAVPGWVRPGAEVVLLGAGDHFEIAETELCAQSVGEWEDELSDLLELQLE